MADVSTPSRPTTKGLSSSTTTPVGSISNLNKPRTPGSSNINLTRTPSTKPSPGASPSISRSGSSGSLASTANGTGSTPKGSVLSPATKNKYAHVKSKIGSMENLTHAPRGGDKKIFTQKVEIKAESKVDARTDHKPKGGDVKIFSQKLEFSQKAAPKVDARSDHKPASSDVKIFSQKVDVKAAPKVGSLENVNHVAGGGKVAIKSEKLNFKDKAAPKVDAPRTKGSMSPRSSSIASRASSANGDIQSGNENVAPSSENGSILSVQAIPPGSSA
ncbi:hypothetical protein BC829DRAFT_407750 [Chytridium lagenaria]|nr:hypothetical protein BC829DRAFT_407750 [Chytridium lagenaria]